MEKIDAYLVGKKLNEWFGLFALFIKIVIFPFLWIGMKIGIVRDPKK
jgi:hypothetical protein